MVVRSGGKKPQTKQSGRARQAKTASRKNTASFKDSLKDREAAGHASPQPQPQPRSAPLSGWSVIFILLFLAFAVVGWGLWRSAPVYEPVDINFSAATPGEKVPEKILEKTLEKTPEKTIKKTAEKTEAATTIPSPLHRDETDRRVAALEAGLAALENRPVSGIPAAGAPDPATARRLESTEAALTALMDRLAGLESRLARAEVSNEGGWALVITGAELRAALRGSAPFAAELKAFRETAAALRGGDGADGPLNAALAALDAYAEDGVPTPELLKKELNDLAPRVVAADSRENAASGKEEWGEEGWVSGLRARLGSLISIRRTGAGVAGTTAEAVTARAEAALVAGDLKTAVTEMETLQGAQAIMAASWLAGARARLAAEESLAAISRRVTVLLVRGKSQGRSDIKGGDGG